MDKGTNRLIDPEYELQLELNLRSDPETWEYIIQGVMERSHFSREKVIEVLDLRLSVLWDIARGN